ncbi:hypothetical protein, partial [Clostridium sp.]|uniref:hypothetical protein n=1 Tax=Clostridium sp. TaxID=1506 RepID=UPI0034640DB9
YRSYEKKDKEFKEYVKENPYSYFLISGILIYFAYKFWGVGFSVRYSFIVGIFIMANYLIEVYAMTTSRDWVSYRKKSAMVGMVFIFIVMFLF